MDICAYNMLVPAGSRQRILISIHHGAMVIDPIPALSV